MWMQARAALRRLDDSPAGDVIGLSAIMVVLFAALMLPEPLAGAGEPPVAEGVK
jgi:hypothetical protein